MRISLLLLLLVPLACNRGASDADKRAAARPRLAQAHPATAQPAQRLTLAGKVLERLDVGEYSYLRLDQLNGEQWAAVLKCTVEKGDEVVVRDAAQMDGFESKTLKRKFDHIVFGMLGGVNGKPVEPPRARMDAMGAANPHAGMPAMNDAHKPAADLGSIKVARATGAGAVTVAEAFQKGKGLDGKPVIVRAQVVKVLTNIMGKTWVHVRDGSGSPADKNDDLVVTTLDSTQVGDEVLVRGTLHAQRDFGAGYRFDAIVEDAHIALAGKSAR